MQLLMGTKANLHVQHSSNTQLQLCLSKFSLVLAVGCLTTESLIATHANDSK